MADDHADDEASDRAWTDWCNKVEALLGHKLTNLDSAYTVWKVGFSPEGYAVLMRIR